MQGSVHHVILASKGEGVTGMAGVNGSNDNNVRRVTRASGNFYIMGGGIEVQLLEFGVYPGNKNLYRVYLSNLPVILGIYRKVIRTVRL